MLVLHSISSLQQRTLIWCNECRQGRAAFLVLYLLTNPGSDIPCRRELATCTHLGDLPGL